MMGIQAHDVDLFNMQSEKVLVVALQRLPYPFAITENLSFCFMSCLSE
jgi:hypothetical protein